MEEDSIDIRDLNTHIEILTDVMLKYGKSIDASFVSALKEARKQHRKLCGY